MIIDAGIDVTLPGGTWRSGVRLERATLRPLATGDELFVAETGAALLPVTCITLLLQRCVVGLDTGDSITQADLRSLTIGDREAILLHLRRASFGNQLECLFACGACGETIEIELSIEDLLVERYAASQPEYERRFELGDTSCTVVFRSPSIDDIDAVAPLARRGVDAAVDQLLVRCIRRVDVDGEPIGMDGLPHTVKDQLDAFLQDVDPQAEMLLGGDCPVCGHPYSVLLDVGSVLIQELAEQADEFYRDVQTLAREFHWSERDILRLPARRRHAE